jgi:hypothetical protein
MSAKRKVKSIVIDQRKGKHTFSCNAPGSCVSKRRAVSCCLLRIALDYVVRRNLCVI